MKRPLLLLLVAALVLGLVPFAAAQSDVPDTLVLGMVPSREADAIVKDARTRLKGTLVVDYVPADYHSDFPKRCMGGWGTTGLNVSPDGLVLPCHAAQTIPHLEFDNVRDRPLRDIWYEGDAFNAYRGTEWMQEPCRTCEHKLKDFGGCRCQAMAIVGDAAATDPVCIKSPHHGTLQAKADAFSHNDTAGMIHRSAPGKSVAEPAD